MCKIFIYILLCLGAACADVLGERKRTYAVHNSEIDRLCARTHKRSHLVNRRFKYRCRRLSVYILIIQKCLFHCRIIGNMRENAQLNLRIIGVNQCPSVLFGNKHLSYLSAEGRSNRNILKVRLGTAQSSRICHRLVKV